MKRESLTVRFDRMERRLRRIQIFSLLAVTALSCALLAQRGVSQEATLANGSFDELSVKSLRVESINARDVVALSIFSQDSFAKRLGVAKDGKGKDMGGVMLLNDGGGAHLVMFDPQGSGRFMADSSSDPILAMKPFNGKYVQVPMTSN
jgi:hypothetical protein